MKTSMLIATVIGGAIIADVAGWSVSAQRGSYVQCRARRVRKIMPHAKASSAASRPSSFIPVISGPSLSPSSSTPWMLTSTGAMKRASSSHLAAEPH